jgi:hypothetical protein
MQTEQILERRVIRRVMLPETEEMTREAADIEDARKIRYGFSPSYYLNLGSMTGNRYVGYGEIFPRTLYRFDKVHPTGINESPDRLDEERENLPAFAATTRSPRTCAEDVRSEAGPRVFAILSTLTDRDDAQEIWDVIYPVDVEAQIWARTDRAIRGLKAPDYLRAFFDEELGLEAPYVIDGGHGLALFIRHLEQDAPRLIREARFRNDVLEAAEGALAEILQAASEAFQHRYARLHASFGSLESRQNGGTGKNRLDRHDWQCITETGIERPEDKPVAASQRMGTAMGQAIAERSAHSEGQLAEAVKMLAEGQRAMQEEAALDRKMVLELLRGRE